MLNIIEKPFHFGLGLISYSKEKVEKLADELAKTGKIEKKDVDGFVNEILEKGEEQRDSLKQIINGEISKVLNKMSVAKKEDILSEERLRKIIREELQNIMDKQSGENGEKKEKE